MIQVLFILVAFPHMETVSFHGDWDYGLDSQTKFLWSDGKNADNVIREDYFENLDFYTDIKVMVVNKLGNLVYSEFDYAK